MTPKEKAVELIAKFKKITSYKYQEYADANYSVFEHDIEIIKECAFSEIEEVRKELKEFDNFDGYAQSRLDFWLNVQIEIEAIK